MNHPINISGFLSLRSKICMLLLTLFCSCHIAHAQEFQFIPDVVAQRFIASERPGYVYGERIHLVTQDLWGNMTTNPTTWNQKYKFKSIANIIKVGINHDAKIAASNFKYRIVLKIKGYKNPASPLIAEEGNGMFDLEYNNDSLVTYPDQNTIKFGVEGYHQMDVWIDKIYDISVPGQMNALPWSAVQKNFYIETSISTQRYDLEKTALAPNSNYDASKHELNVSWSLYQPGVNTDPGCNGFSPYINYKPAKYELEWTYIDDYKLLDFKNQSSSYGYKNTSGSFTIPYDFKNNATRIQTYKLNFTIPVIYEHGAIVFRIRMIRPDLNDYTKMNYSDWTLPDIGTLTQNNFGTNQFAASPYKCPAQCICIIPAAMENDKFDWQYSINFAEEGKYKHVLNYFDGAGHNRQTQTKINSDNQYIVAADHIYDYEGRAAIQTLPTPVISQNLNYKPDLSYKSGTTQPYKAADFDKGCVSDSIYGLDNNSLAGRYYSPSNPDKTGMQQFVPDAQGYPFIESIYSPDNTNKVIWQGGAGLDFQRFKNHGTYNAYIRANQTELNALFGTQAGKNEYYPKVVTRDPNGQLSYSIFNQTGKVVATALAGNAPNADTFPIVSLDGMAPAASFTTDILANLTQSTTDGLRAVNHTFFPEAGGNSSFLYHGYIPPYNTQCGGQYINLKGIYNIKVVDECGNIKKQQGPSEAGLTNISTSASGQAFSAPPSGQFALNPEKYTLVKELYFADTAINRLSNEFTITNSGPDKCYDYEDNFIRRAIESTTFPCKSEPFETHCDVMRKKMKEELYPGAKYGQYVKNADGTFAQGAPNSIFTQVNDAGEDLADLVGANGSNTCYYIKRCSVEEGDSGPLPNNNNNNPNQFQTSTWETQVNCAPNAVINHLPYSNGTYTCINSDITCPDLNAKYRYQWNCTTLPNVAVPVAGNPNVFAFGPANGLTPQQLIDNFSDAIAEKLLPYHPEFCKLLLCDDHLEDILKKITSYKDAEALGLNTLQKIYTADPLCTVNPNGQLSIAELSKLFIANAPSNNNYSSSNLTQNIDKLALEKAYCGCESAETYAYCRTQQFKANIDAMQMVDTQVQNAFIKNLIALYIANRNIRVQKRIDGAASNCDPCGNKQMQLIGNPVFTPVFNGNSFAGLGLSADVLAALNQSLSGTPGSVPGSISSQVLESQASNVTTQVDAIINALDNNCNLTNPVALANLSFYLKNPTTCGTNGEKLTPDVVKAAMAIYNIPVTDLCNPYLATYGLFDTTTKTYPSTFRNKPVAFYDGLKTFLARTEVKNSLKNAVAGGSGYYSGTLTTTNAFDNELALSLGIANNGSFRIKSYKKTLTDAGTLSSATRYVYMLTLSSTVTGSSKDTIYLTKRVGVSLPSDCSPVTAGDVLINGSATNINKFSFKEVHSVLDDALFNNLSDGYIADNLVYAQLSGKVNASVTGCDNYAIWGAKISMLQRKNASSMDDCINCVQLRTAVKNYFADAATNAFPTYTNHQNFPKIFSNYLNIKLKKKHSYFDYEKLMNGCALSNFIAFKATKGQYHLVYNESSLATLNALIADINNTMDGNLGYSSYKDAAGNIHVWIDGNTIPQAFAYRIQQKIKTAQPSALTVDEPDIITELWLPQNGCTTFPPITATVGMTLSYGPTIKLPDANGVYNQSYTKYVIGGLTTSTAITEKAVSDCIQYARAFLSNPTYGCSGVIMNNGREVMRTADFTSNTDRQNYLNYVYALEGQTQSAISDAISAGVLQSNNGIAPFKTAALVSYQDPWCSNVKTDLNYAVNTTTANANWTLLNSYFNSVTAKLGSSKLFPAANITTITGTGTANELPSFKAIKMSNGTIWHRIFTGPNKRMNFYLSPAANMVGNPADYTIVSGAQIEPVIGPDTVYRFKVLMQKTLPNSTVPHTVTCYGWADFSLMAAKSITNVVLSDYEEKPGCTDTLPCERIAMQNAIRQGSDLYALYIDSIKKYHYLAMRDFFPANTVDTLDFTTLKLQYQYTLYNYDLVGNLTSTIPPQGVNPMPDISGVDKARNDKNLSTTYYPANTKKSEYWYNNYNQLIKQQTPDGGLTYFYYDNANRLTFSVSQQNIQDIKYGYTLYDRQGRISETGSAYIPNSDPPSNGIIQMAQQKDGAAIATEIHSYKRVDVVSTFYDEALLNLSSNEGLNDQENLRKRVSSILYSSELSPNQSAESYYNYATHFSYDALGNVKTLVVDNPYLDYLGQRFKRVDYDYDLLSGKVNMVSYNRGHNDQFYQKYTYDADNRIITTQSSNNASTWDRDASYEYYKHGPLAKMNVGDLSVQSLQYAYTIQGWLKAINSDVLDTTADMGHDGMGTSLFPADAMAHSLDYFKNDYKPIGDVGVTYAASGLTKGLYNGNIARQTTGIAKLDNLQRNYTYDQLNRIKETRYNRVDNLNHAVIAMANAFANTYSYDKDGNILKLTRNNESGTRIDDFTYQYPANADNNRLASVADAATNTSGIDLAQGQAANNYDYDLIGNLKKDAQGNIDDITWNAYNKVTDMKMQGGSKNIHYDYDGTGNRIKKDVIVNNNGLIRATDVYVRDASGNILAVYKGKGNAATGFTNDVITAVQSHGKWNAPNIYQSPVIIGNDQASTATVDTFPVSDVAGIDNTSDSVDIAMTEDSQNQQPPSEDVEIAELPQTSNGLNPGGGTVIQLINTLNPSYTPPVVNTPVPVGISNDTLYLAEHHLYGSSRLGMKTYDADKYRVIYAEGAGTGFIQNTISSPLPWFNTGLADWIKRDKVLPYTGATYNLSIDGQQNIRILGAKQYELTDHLGNVLATVLDKKTGSGSTNGLYNRYYANLSSVQDYYPFGMMMPGRSTAYGLQPATASNPIVVSNYFEGSSIEGWQTYGQTPLEAVNGKLKASIQGPYQGMSRVFNTTAGHVYRIKYNIDIGTFTAPLTSSILSWPGWNLYGQQGSTSYIEQTFTAGSDQSIIVIETNGYTPSGINLYYFIDNFTVEEVIAQPPIAGGLKGYRFGFNGQMKTDEVYGSGNFIDFENRGVDTRIGRWLSTDNVHKAFTSAYQFGSNNPTNMIDPNGNDEIHFTYTRTATIDAFGRKDGPGTTQVKIVPKDGPDAFIWHNVTNVYKFKQSAPSSWYQSNVSGSYTFSKTETSTVILKPLDPTSASGVTTHKSYLMQDLITYDTKNRDCISVGKVMDQNREFGAYMESRYKISSDWKTVGGALSTVDRFAQSYAQVMFGEGVGLMAGAAYKGAPKSFKDLSSNPSTIWGRSADEVGQILGDGWTQKPLNSGEGWKFVQNDGDGFVSYTTGNRHHPNSEYYKINSGVTGKIKVVKDGYRATKGDKSKIITIGSVGRGQ